MADFTSGRIAHRYADALYEAAVEDRVLQTVASQMEVFARVLENSADLRILIASPVLGAEARWRGLSAVLHRLSISGFLRNFLGLMTHKGRLFLWESVYKIFCERVREGRGQIFVSVRVAQPDPKGRALLVRALHRATGKKTCGGRDRRA